MNIKTISTKYAIEQIKINKSIYEPEASIFTRSYIRDQKKLLKNDVINDIKSIGYSAHEAKKFFYNYVLRESEKIDSEFLIDPVNVCLLLSIDDLRRTKQILLDRHTHAISILEKI